MTSKKKLKKRINRGVAFLDEVKPKWLKKIKLKKLNISHDKKCVLGQVFGSFGKAAEDYNLSYHSGSIEKGFASFHVIEDEKLTKLWKKKIKKLRKAA